MIRTGILFSRDKLTTFLACQRRFQLRYLQELSWPVAPQDEQWREASERGAAFHKMLERHFLGLPPQDTGDDPPADPQLAAWWETFQRAGPTIPPGRLLPEVTLTAPVGRHLLTGRFDLLVLGEDSAHIFDWKTESHPRPAAVLEEEWQTILYLALLIEGRGALWPGKHELDPGQLQLTYWFVNDPAASVTLTYSRQAHAKNWARIEAVVAQIEAQLDDGGAGAWPKTDDWSLCGRCVYQVFCGRQGSPAGEPVEWEEKEVWEWEDLFPLEPDRP